MIAIRFAALALLASGIVAQSETSSTSSTGFFNPLMAAPQAVPASSTYGSLSLSGSGSSLPRADSRSSLGREVQARRDSAVRIRNQYDAAVKGRGQLGSFSLAPVRFPSPPGYISPPTRGNANAANRPSGSTRNASSATPNTLPTIRIPSDGASTRTSRFPSLPSLGVSSNGSSMVLSGSSSGRASRPVAVARSPQPSPRIRVANQTSLQRKIAEIDKRIAIRRASASTDGVNRRIAEINRRYDRRVQERISDMRMAGKLDRLSVDNRGRLIDPKTNARPGAEVLSRSNRNALQKERDKLIKEARGAAKSTSKFLAKLNKQKEKLTRKQAKANKKPKPPKKAPKGRK